MYGNRSLKKHGFDIRGHGGQVVAAGSKHPVTGNPYQVLKDVTIAESPEFLLKLTAGEDIKAPQGRIIKEISAVELDSLPIRQETKDLIRNSKPNGERSEALMTVLNALVGAGLSNEKIISVLNQYPIGEKYLEKNNAKHNWIMSQIKKAREYVSTPEQRDANPQETAEQKKLLVLAQPESVRDFLNRNIPERKPLIHHLLNIEEFHIASGPAKQGKTLLGMNMAMSLASGQYFLGNKIDKPQVVLYVQQEVAQYFFKERLEIMIAEYIRGHKNANEISDLIQGNLFHWSYRGLHIDDENHLSQIKKWIEERKPAVIFFDPLYLLHTKDENRTDDMARLMEIFHSLISQYNISIFLIHHAGKKSDYSGGDLHRGSSVLQGASDGNWILRKEKNDRLNLSLDLRNQRKIDDITLNREPDSLWFDVVYKENLISSTIVIIKNKVSFHGEVAQKDLLDELKKEVSERTLYIILPKNWTKV